MIIFAKENRCSKVANIARMLKERGIANIAKVIRILRANNKR
jgi:hypothetical protein